MVAENAVVVPAFNEADSIAKVVTDFRAALPGGAHRGRRQPFYQWSGRRCACSRRRSRA